MTRGKILQMPNDDLYIIATNTVLIFVASAAARKCSKYPRLNARRIAIAIFLMCFVSVYLVCFYARALPLEKSLLSGGVTASVITIAFFALRWGWSRQR